MRAKTLSRLNRTFPGKAECGTFVLDFYNDPEDILDAFQPYFQTATLDDVTDPNQIFDLQEKLNASGIYKQSEVDQFVDAFFAKNKSSAALSNLCRPALDRWNKRYKLAKDAYLHAKQIFERTKKSGDPVLIANAENSFAECKKEKDSLDIFKKDLGTFIRFYEFMSQVVDYDDASLEKLSLFAKALRPLLREDRIEEDEVDLSSVEMSHYRLSKIRQQDIKLQETTLIIVCSQPLDAGTAKPKDKKEEFLSNIIHRLNEVFVTDNLTDGDLINYAFTVRDKLRENQTVMNQIENNTREQAMLGDFPKAIDDAIMDSNEAHQDQMMQLLTDPAKTQQFARVIFDMLSGKVLL